MPLVIESNPPVLESALQSLIFVFVQKRRIKQQKPDAGRQYARRVFKNAHIANYKYRRIDVGWVDHCHGINYTSSRFFFAVGGVERSSCQRCDAAFWSAVATRPV